MKRFFVLVLIIFYQQIGYAQLPPKGYKIDLPHKGDGWTIKILYDAVSENYDLGSYNEFVQKLHNPNKRVIFYNEVSKYYNLGTFDVFSSKVDNSLKNSNDGSLLNDYISKTYIALKENLDGFNKSEEEYRKLVTSNSDYRHRVYLALKDNLKGFNKTYDAFSLLILTDTLNSKIPFSEFGGDNIKQQNDSTSDGLTILKKQKLHYKKGLFINLTQAYGIDNLPDENTFYNKLNNDANYRKGVYENLIKAFGQENLPDFGTFENKIKSDSILSDSLNFRKGLKEPSKSSVDKLIVHLDNFYTIKLFISILLLLVLFTIAILVYTRRKLLNNYLIKLSHNSKDSYNNIARFFLRKSTLITLAVIMFILLLSNPTMSDFKEHIGYDAVFARHRYEFVTRNSNWLIFSTYNNGDEKYIGILKNFWKLN